MSIEQIRILSTDERIKLCSAGVGFALREPAAESTGRQFPWLQPCSVANVKDEGGYMELGISGPDQFFGFLCFQGEANWGLNEEQLTLLGSMAGVRPYFETASPYWDGRLYRMAMVAVDLEHAA